MNRLNKSLALFAAMTFMAAASTGCTSSAKKDADNSGAAKVAVSIPASSVIATAIGKATLTVGPGTGTPSFANIVTDLTNQDLSGKLSWSGYVQGIPAGTGRTFHIDAFDGAGAVIYAGDATATITAGSTANVYMVLQEKNPTGGSSNHLPVVSSLTSSATTVTVGLPGPSPTVSLAVTATDPDQTTPLTYLWTATCGALTGATTTTPVWTAPPAPAPAAGACQINVTVTDNASGSVTASLAIIVQNPVNGAAQVTAYPNSWPVIAGIVASETFTKDATGAIVSIDVDLTITASDPDADDLIFVWSSPDCLFPAAGFTTLGITTPAATVTHGPGALGTRSVHFKSGDPSHGCTIKVDVQDAWKNGLIPANSGLTLARGGDTVGFIYASTPKDFAIAPQITKVTSPNAGNQVQPSQAVVLGIEVKDPTPLFNTALTPFTFTWTQTGGAFVALSQVDVTTSPGKSVIQWNAPATLVAGMSVTVRVANTAGLSTTYTWNLVPANACALPGSNGTACDTGQGLCAPNGACLNGACVSPTPVTCTAQDQCHDVGVCNTATGTCSQPVKANGTTCSDGKFCTATDVCTAGVCGGTPVACTQNTNVCQAATGTCAEPTGTQTTFTCNFANLAAATDCTAAGQATNKCYASYTCDGAGACGAVATSLNTCPSTTCRAGGVCNPGTGNCDGSANQPATVACDDLNPCTTGDHCSGSGTCSPGPGSACSPGQACSAAGTAFTCADTVVSPVLAKDFPVGTLGLAGLAMGSDGSTYATAPLFFPDRTIDGTIFTSAGDSDLFVAKYPAGGGAYSWAVRYGDAGKQTPSGAAVTANGTVAVIGQYTGAFGTISNTNPTAVDFLALLNGSTGALSAAKSIDNGVSGGLKAIAANPKLNQIAVCGAADKLSSLVTTGVYGGGTQDIIIAMYDTAGTLAWAKQFGGIGEEECDALAIDDVGDLYAAGQYDNALTFTGTALPSPASSFRRWLWVAKFNGTTGAAISQASFGAGAGNHRPLSIAIDSTGKLVMAGFMTNSLNFNGTVAANLLTSAGSNDAFVAKLDPASVTPFAHVWSARVGGIGADVANGLALDSFDNVTVVGSFNGATTGAAVLSTTFASSASFVLKFNGATGTVVAGGAAGYAGFVTATPTTGTAGGATQVVINRFGTGTAKDAVTFGGNYSGSLNFAAAPVPAALGIQNPNVSEYLVFGALK